MGEIVNDLMLSLKAHLQQKMVDAIPAEYEDYLKYTDAEDVERALTVSRILIGRLQQDPTGLPESSLEPSVHIAIEPNDPDEEDWQHTVASSVESSATNLGLRLGNIYEIGGTRRWWRRFRLYFRAFYTRSNQSKAEAIRLTNLVRAMLERFCESYRPDNLHGWNCTMTDMFNESALEAHVAKSYSVEQGGPGDYIGEGSVWVQVHTERE